MAKQPKVLLQKYGVSWTTTDPVAIELECIRRNGEWTDHLGNKCGAGLVHHVKAFQSIAWPWKLWNRWNEGLMLPELCRGGRLAIFGPASSWKSTEAVFFGLTMYYARPVGTTVFCSSTTLDSLNRRIFGYVKEFHKSAKERIPWLPGNLIESKNMLVTDDRTTENRNFKNGVLGVACKKSGGWTGIQEFIGTKNDVVILLADECQYMPDGFWDAGANLDANDNTTIVAIGNLPDTFCPLAKAAEPKLGWDSLPETDKSRVYDTRWFDGRAVQLIGLDSPNLDAPEGKEPFPKLIGRRFIKQAEHNYGKDTPLYHMFVSGRVPRGTMDKVVVSRSECLKFHAMEEVVWGHEPLTKGYMLDAAYKGVGGDRTAGCPFAFGKDVTGAHRFALLGRPRVYTGSESQKIEHEEAIAIQCRSDCEQLEIPPEHVFFDGTGRSSLTIAFARLWSPRVVPIEFGGSATERPGFTGMRHLEGPKEGDIKTCRECYDRFVTELAFAVKACIVFDQMRGLTEEIVEELCRRLWMPKPGGRQGVEIKDDMRERLGRSPDLADMLAAGIEGARRLGFPLGTIQSVSRKSRHWLQKMNRDFESANRAQELVSN